MDHDRACLVRFDGDLVNGMFETAGACVTWANVWRTLQARRVIGVSWSSMWFFTLWGLWNVWFYPSVGLRWSFAGGCMLALANLVWILLRWRLEWRDS